MIGHPEKLTIGSERAHSLAPGWSRAWRECSDEEPNAKRPLTPQIGAS